MEGNCYVRMATQEVFFMQDAPGERLKALCEEASTEQDPQKLLALITEINCLLEEKRLRPNGNRVDSQASND